MMHPRFPPSFAAACGAALLTSCAAPEDAPPGSQGSLIATTRSTAAGGTRTAYERAGDPEGIVNRNGRLYYVKDRGTTLLSRREQRVTNELSVEANGMISLGDGRRVRLRDGEMVTRGGELREAPPYLRAGAPARTTL